MIMIPPLGTRQVSSGAGTEVGVRFAVRAAAML